MISPVMATLSVADTIPTVEFAAVYRGLYELSRGNPDVLQEFVGLLADSLRRSSDMLVSAVDAGGRGQVVRAAHALRGTSLTSGLTSIAGLAETIEIGDADGDALRAAAARLHTLVEYAIAVVRAPHAGDGRP